MGEKYYVIAWEWNAEREEYETKTRGEFDNYHDAVAKACAMTVNADTPQVELWEEGEAEDIRHFIKYAYNGKEEKEWERSR